MRSKKVPNTNADLPTIKECKEVVLELDFPGEITESTIERVVGTFLEGRDLLPDLRALKKYIRYVFGKRIGRIRHTRSGTPSSGWRWTSVRMRSLQAIFLNQLSM